MKKIIFMIAVIGLIGVFVNDSNAQTTKTPHGKKRIERQNKRIKRGVKSGSLTKKETAKLGRQRHKVKSDVKTAKSDGKLTVKERGKLRKDLNRSSKGIYKAKHNRVWYQPYKFS